MAVLKTHDTSDIYQAGLRAGEIVGLYSFRDIRDVVFSMMHKQASSYHQLVHVERLIDRLLAVDASWRGLPNVVVQQYEKIVANPRRAIAQIAERVGIAAGERDVDEIAALYSLEANRARARALELRLRSQGVDLSDPCAATLQDPQTLIHWNHIRRASLDWRSLATDAQRRELTELAGPWLLRHGYDLD